MRSFARHGSGGGRRGSQEDPESFQPAGGGACPTDVTLEDLEPAVGRGAEPDPEDVRRAAAGELAAFGRVYRATVGRVHGLARRLLGREHADEATQEVYLRAWRKLGSFRGEAGFATWLHRLATNEILNLRARLERREQVVEAWEGEPAAGAGAGLRSDLAADLEAALARLPAGARTVFVLHDVEGLEHAEVARRLGVGVGTSKSQLHRARALLREALGAWKETDHG